MTYAGGGGGGSTSTAGGAAPGSGGAGGGGQGGRYSSPTATSGAANTGGGGGGWMNGTPGLGGSGIVVLSYANTFSDFSSISGLTYTKTSSGGNTIYTFTSGTGTVTL